ncbi:MAG TPA: FtsW/RodA/SpoVE family cell cycle protein, partial [Nitrospiria bacterium]|nr:FtsW/RodA/SpoVE family cell cycle protein [Nitrospiria bacterium]
MQIDRRALARFDWAFLGVIALILGIGVISIYSVTFQPAAGGKTPLYVKQIYWICLGLAAFVIMAWIDYHEIVRFAYPAYGITIVLLLLVLAVGRVGLGAKRWLALGFFSVQPSEVAKLTLLLVLAKYFSENSPRRGLSFGQLMVPGFLMLVPLLLIMKQPDLGTSLAISSVFITLVFLMGVRSRFFIYSFLFSTMLFPFLWHFFWRHLKDYQKERLLTFLDPSN